MRRESEKREGYEEREGEERVYEEREGEEGRL